MAVTRSRSFVKKYYSELPQDLTLAIEDLREQISWLDGMARDFSRLRLDVHSPLVQHINHVIDIPPSAVEGAVNEIKNLANHLRGTLAVKEKRVEGDRKIKAAAEDVS